MKAPPNCERLSFLRLCENLGILGDAHRDELAELDLAAAAYEVEQEARLRSSQSGDFEVPIFARPPAVRRHRRDFSDGEADALARVFGDPTGGRR